MSSGKIFVTFVIPVIVTAIVYAAMLANERAVRRSDREPGE